MSCLTCRSKKLKCDRLLPSCSRCTQSGEDCVFPGSRKTITGRPRKIRELETKLVQLEHQLAAFQANQQQASEEDTVDQPIARETSNSLEIPIEDDQTSHGSQPATIETYFDNMGWAAPMIHKARFMESLSQQATRQTPKCLIYIIMALGASVSRNNQVVAKTFYQCAKAQARSTDSKGEGQDSITLSHIQYWALVANFEAQQMMFSQAVNSLCRGIRTAQLLHLHRLDKQSEDSAVASAEDWIELEERRRTWWVLFIADRLVCGTTGLPLCIDERETSTLLPTTEEAFAEGRRELTETLESALSLRSVGQSILTIRVIAALFFQHTLEHTSPISPSSCLEVEQDEFWNQHRRLDNDLSLLLMNLPDTARLSNFPSNPDAVMINTHIHAAIISLHRGGLWNIRYSDNSAGEDQWVRQQARQSHGRLLNSAEEIAHILRMAPDCRMTFINPILNFAVYLAILVFIEDYLERQKQQSEDTAQFLLSVLVTISQDNAVAKSLANQVARDMYYVGIEVPPDLVSIPSFEHLDEVSKR
ncbi:uncharacterized protein NECHADRAFT_55833 [Fusarium vanettenii 77-13-4]|uniref:Zn(2)-C6 fungal-type domain-containing protein n=1 Tax=Fusarium vanettenii (strain ATCC MYA-4622 / CBS 123669 / FGSC 9596 / NRRL 45880 / 77-13-4) TaxID=660122 RepID=C7ZPV7_FUSV7|nr:uncharacterized protein NECHADRAFT_55833 [Fusarium vanettenii 77-13-4]EEU33938.1 hypothetical protein NECHADRAFT_55833 [Fusarium vanettenii 77-13-4]